MVVHPSSIRLRETMRKRKQRGGTDRDTYTARSRERRATAQQMRADGIKAVDIAALLGCSVREIYRLTKPSSSNADVVDVANALHGCPTLQEYDGGTPLVEPSHPAQIMEFPAIVDRKLRKRQSRPNIEHDAYCSCADCKPRDVEPWWLQAPQHSLFGSTIDTPANLSG